MSLTGGKNVPLISNETHFSTQKTLFTIQVHNYYEALHLSIYVYTR